MKIDIEIKCFGQKQVEKGLHYGSSVVIKTIKANTYEHIKIYEKKWVIDQKIYIVRGKKRMVPGKEAEE